MSNVRQKNRGIISTIILVVVALLIVSLFGFSIRDALQDETVRDNFRIVSEVLRRVWGYIETPAVAVWEFLRDVIFEPFADNLENLKEGESAIPDALPEPPR